jgi:outer membrane receptor protein involved in Fe transport
VDGSPCTNLARYVNGKIVPVSTKDNGFLYRLNLTWKPTDAVLLYGTWSRGYRPGGINRRGTLPPYAADFLTNYEIGWKTTLADGHLRLNGALYRQDWSKFQFSFLGQNSFTEIHNGPNARIYGLELDANYHQGGLTLTASGAWTDAKTTQNLCSSDDPTYTCAAPNSIAAAKGTRLPVTPQLKANATARYDFKGGSTDWWVQGVVAYQGSASSDIRVAQALLLGDIKSSVTADFSVGAKLSKFSLELFLANAFDERAEISRFVPCSVCYQRPYYFYERPRTVGVRAGTSF